MQASVVAEGRADGKALLKVWRIRTGLMLIFGLQKFAETNVLQKGQFRNYQEKTTSSLPGKALDFGALQQPIKFFVSKSEANFFYCGFRFRKRVKNVITSKEIQEGSECK
jgi:hypothetical protein